MKHKWFSLHLWLVTPGVAHILTFHCWSDLIQNNVFPYKGFSKPELGHSNDIFNQKKKERCQKRTIVITRRDKNYPNKNLKCSRLIINVQDLFLSSQFRTKNCTNLILWISEKKLFWCLCSGVTLWCGCFCRVFSSFVELQALRPWTLLVKNHGFLCWVTLTVSCFLLKLMKLSQVLPMSPFKLLYAKNILECER